MGVWAAIVWEKVTVDYGHQRALDAVSLAVRSGEIVALTGPNGSGKSTLLAVAAGARQATAGRVWVQGLDRQTDPRRYARQLGWSPQQGGLYEELTLEQNLCLFGRLQGLSGNELRCQVQRVLRQFGLTSRAAHQVKTLSGGWRQRVNIAAALVHNPSVVLLDEPTAGLDEDSRQQLWTLLDQLREEGCAVVVATHQAEDITAICDRVVRLQAGRVQTVETTDLQSGLSGSRAVLYGQLRWRPPRWMLRSVRQRLPADIQVELIGRRLRLQAANGEKLGYALAEFLREGIAFASYRTAAY
ncbi:MAG: ABC transporter ATP-binding protein [Gemmataceae bacterium]|nr:ABC transporter ATP-binding protein [Gemmataceae bacterium]MDW8241652.1 ABC transporter ATP-binding protein [Thermogemmata sp.]